MQKVFIRTSKDKFFNLDNIVSIYSTSGGTQTYLVATDGDRYRVDSTLEDIKRELSPYVDFREPPLTL